MPRRVYSDHLEELSLRLANRQNITLAMRTHFLDDAYLAIVNEFDHPEFQALADDTVLAGQSLLVPAATDLWWPVFVKDITNDRPIDKKSLEEVESGRVVVGVVTDYYWWNNALLFNRTAEQTFNVTLWYKRRPDPWTSGSAEFSPLFDPLLPMRAAKLGLDTVGDQQAAHIQETEYRNYVATMKLSTNEAEKNDRRTGLRVRYR